MDALYSVVGSLVVCVGTPWALALVLVGPMMDSLWERLYALERSERARDGILGLVASWAVLCTVILGVRLGVSGGASWLALGLLLGLALVGALLGLRQSLAPESRDATPRIPARCRQDHDGLDVTLTHRSALPAILLTGSFPLWPLSWLLAAVLVVLPRRTVAFRVRISAAEVETGGRRTVLPLQGLRVLEEEGLDGTSQICLLHGEGSLRVGVGGHDPAEVAWVVAQLREAARCAPLSAPQPDPPDALRLLLAQDQRERA